MGAFPVLIGYELIESYGDWTEKGARIVGWIKAKARNVLGWWKRVGKKIADFQARFLLAVFYFSVFAPFALAVRWWSDPLAIKGRGQTGWRLREEETMPSLERATKQF